MDVSNSLRPDAPTSEDRLFCHVYGRGDRKTDQFVPGGSQPKSTTRSPRLITPSATSSIDSIPGEAVNQDSCANGSSE
ncbi:hypothetical protein ACFQ10_50765 [Streptomyces indonesiensis]